MVIGALALAVVGADQLTKELAVTRLASAPVHLIGPLSLQLAYNRGVAFSLGSGLGSSIIILIIVVVVVAVALLGQSVPGKAGTVGIGLVLGGALGNLLDRLFRSNAAVVDFIHTGFWPTFNLADSGVVIGSLLLGIALVRGHGKGQLPGEKT